jgi:hypothetical protein
MRHQVRCISGAVVGALACGELGPEDYLPPGSPPPIATDASVYALEHTSGAYRAVAHATYTNWGSRSVYLHHASCGGGVSWVVRARRTGSDSTAPTVVGTPNAVPTCDDVARLDSVLPGETQELVVWLGSPDIDDAAPSTVITPEQRVGQYRIELMLCARQKHASGDCEPVPQVARQSDPIKITFAEP